MSSYLILVFGDLTKARWTAAHLQRAGHPVRGGAAVHFLGQAQMDSKTRSELKSMATRHFGGKVLQEWKLVQDSSTRAAHLLEGVGDNLWSAFKGLMTKLGLRKAQSLMVTADNPQEAQQLVQFAQNMGVGSQVLPALWIDIPFQVDMQEYKKRFKSAYRPLLIAQAGSMRFM